jgi:cytochrome c nitrite reductase small subunit
MEGVTRSHKTSPFSSWTTLALYVSLGICLGVGIVTFEAGKGWSYLSDNPQTCVNCHIMRDQYDSWQKASHHAFATCNSCHVPHDPIGKWLVKGENGFRHSWAFTFQDFPEPIQAREVSRQVIEHNCRDCHQSLVSEIAAHKSNHQHTHDPHANAMQCLHCHANVGHGASF